MRGIVDGIEVDKLRQRVNTPFESLRGGEVDRWLDEWSDVRSVGTIGTIAVDAIDSRSHFVATGYGLHDKLIVQMRLMNIRGARIPHAQGNAYAYKLDISISIP